jgi:hypothetical protein
MFESLPRDALATDVALVEDRPTVAVLAERDTPILIFEFSAANGWEQASAIGVDWGGAEIMPMQILLVDLTGDGSAEFFVEHIPYNDTLGVVYRHHTDGRWTLEVEGRAMTPTPQGNLRGYDETCVPDCAAGLVVEYEYSWTGSAFSYQAFDTRGNEIDLYVTTACVGDYIARSGPPLRRCDKGPLVETLQAALQWAGFLVSTDGTPPAVDGYYGPSTETSVRLFQLYLGEPVDGIAEGPWFYDLIENYNLSNGY